MLSAGGSPFLGSSSDVTYSERLPRSLRRTRFSVGYLRLSGRNRREYCCGQQPPTAKPVHSSRQMGGGWLMHRTSLGSARSGSSRILVLASRSSPISARTSGGTPGRRCGVGFSRSRTGENRDDGQLVSERDDFQVQRGARLDEKSERVEQRNDDGRHDCRLSENARNLNRRNTYEVLGSHRLRASICRRSPRHPFLCHIELAQ
jgi:hypothetical protein